MILFSRIISIVSIGKNLIVNCCMGDGLRWRLVSQFHRWPPPPPQLWVWPVLFCYRTFLLLHDLPQKRLVNEMCEYPCVFALSTSETVEKVERKGEREFALCPFQPSVFLCVSAPVFSLPYPSILLLPVKFVFLSVCVSFENNLQLFFLTLISPFCRHLCLPCFVSIYCHLFCFCLIFIVWLSYNLHYVLFFFFRGDW